MANARHSKAGRFVQQRLFAGLSAFVEMERRIADLPDEKSRGDAFEVFTEAYLATQRKHDAETVWPLASVPTETLGSLQLATQDYGVDGVLKTRLGKFSAYQVKFRTSRPALTWRELSTFMGLADSPNIHSRILLTNCDELPSVLNDRQGFFCIRGSDLDRLEPDDFKTIEAWLADAAFVAPKKLPQPHQTEALDALLPALETHDRVSAIMACGTGKTLIALWVAERRQASRILVLVPSLALLRQILHEWLRETSLPNLAYLCVCSDPTVKEGFDAIATAQSDLDFQVSTDATSVREFLDAPFTGTKIVFSTYQSAQVIGAALKPGEAFDLAVFDEAHKTAGREGRKYSVALDDRNIRIRKRLFLTATPRHYNPLSKDEGGDSELLFSMDEPEVYGPQAFRLTFAEAAKRGIICPYKVIISVITSNMVTNELLKRGETFVNGDVVRARQVANQLALKDAIANSGASKVFTFHSRVDAAESFTAKGNEGVSTHLPEFKSFHVNGEMTTALRERIMQDFRASPKAVMSNARCLTEGVDVPAVDMVAFMSPRRSKIDIVQATGRAMRVAPGKTTGFVLVPLYVEQADGETVDLAIQRAEFQEVWQVLQSLQEQDDLLAETISQMREDRGRGGVFDEAAFGDYVDILGPKICLDVLRAAITTKCVDALGSTWDERYGQLKAYRELTGHCLVNDDDSSAYEVQEWIASQPSPQAVGFSRTLEQLRSWVSLQRKLKRSGKLSDERVNKLNEIGFVWGTGRKDWDEMFAELQVFKYKHGHCDLQKQQFGLYQLEGWVEDQQRKFRRGELSAEQVEKLRQLGVTLQTLDSSPQAKWEVMFARLVAYKGKFGDCDVPRHYYGMDNLAWWVVCQRKLRSDGNLDDELIRRLDDIGFVWDRKEYVWDKMFSAVCQLLNSGGVTGLESALQSDDELDKWVRSQQAAKKRNVLTAEKKQALNKAGFPWEFPKKAKEPTKPSWDSFFVRLVEFQKRHGHCDMKLVLPLDEHLHKWAQEQRRARPARTITPDQIAQLDQIRFIWNTDDLLWERMLNALIAYKSIHGDCDVPRYSQDNLQLAVWVASQRKRQSSGKLNSEQIGKLQQIGFNWEDSEVLTKGNNER
jgi:superfamily II DNA or RNA helicase